MRPGQLSRQWCDFFIVPLGLVKLPHAKQVAGGETAQPRLGAGQMPGQLGHHAIAPLRLPDFAADGLADLPPVKLDQGGVDGLHGALAGDADEGRDVVKVGLRDEGRKGGVGCSHDCSKDSCRIRRD